MTVETDGRDDDAGIWPSFSVIVPTYQRRDLVCDALRALAAIEYPGWHETIVVIDGSTDGTQEAIAALSLPVAPRVLRHDNIGLARTRNRGAQEARGDVLLFLDDDMIVQPDILVAHARALAAGADAVMGDIPLDPQSPPGFLSAGVGVWAAERRDRLALGGPIDTGDLLGGHLSIRRAVFEAVGGFDARFTQDGSYGNEDLDMGVRLLARHVVRFCADAVAFQRYVVTPQLNLRQYFQAGEADVLFAAKHPDRADDVFGAHQPGRARARLVLRPLARVPGLHRLLGAAACACADRLWGFSPVIDRFIERFFVQVREVVYWAGVTQAQRMLH
ncbi:glycosyltransferase family 2 protein [Novosphingobium sp. KCTC 2891]|uniref:glycosyltransferase family 2 protein n=1 Tax=Novosphingobium sp. KCTC 2891 TaxID=2989730 RepID=UPI002222DF10|nr:glycosyltransferase family A protein [Novosphingobium sp. KCTC 2891]MCW1383272.1 glycosyltransferase family 2 protein [Novosphingobium sp. KCTC 2891]